MSISAKLVPSSASIVVKSTSTGGLQTTTAGITLKNTVAGSVSVSANGAQRLDGLLDVVGDSANTVSGSTLVYNKDLDKYIVQLLNLDGGSF